MNGFALQWKIGLRVALWASCHGQGTHGTGKTGKMAQKIPCQGKRREFGYFVKTRGFFFFCRKKMNFFSRSWIGLPSQFCVYNSHKLCKLAQGKFVVGQGKSRENTGNLKIQFEWVPCIAPHCPPHAQCEEALRAAQALYSEQNSEQIDELVASWFSPHER